MEIILVTNGSKKVLGIISQQINENYSKNTLQLHMTQKNEIYKFFTFGMLIEYLFYFHEYFFFYPINYITNVLFLKTFYFQI